MTPFIPESAPFDATQRLWLNGYMAGLLAGKYFVPAGTDSPSTRVAPPSVPLLILFGSQTGTAEKLAKEIAKESKAHGCHARVVDAAQHATVEWGREANVLVVTSTYGDGDMPDNAQAFWEWLQTDAARALAHLNFSVLALGDSSYEHFCGAGQKIDARLEALGAKRVHPRADCDVDYEAKAKTWREGVWGVISLAGSSVPAEGTPTPVEPASNEVFSRTNPFPARLLVNRKLNAEGSEKETRHFELSLEGSGLRYEAGDALGVYPTNCPALVEDLLQAIGSNGEEAVSAPGGELPFRKALANTFDITKPSPELLRRIAEGNSVLRALLAPEHKDDLWKWLRGREVLDLLLLAPDFKFSPAELVALLRPLAPRLYSIASSPKTHAGQAHLTVNIVRHHSHGRPRKGVTSTFLADRVGEQTHVPVFVQTSHSFRLPADGHRPVVMVGPGTGVAPFRAFLHERRAVGATGRNWLFFGEQRAAADFYYREELEQMLADGALTKLSTAFSRDQPQKIYVQHRMLEHAAELWAWLQDGAHLYVCGDAARMAKDVDDALHKIIEAAGHKNTNDAKAYVLKLKAEKRYQRDVY